MVRVPFLERLIAKSKERTGTALLVNEIGVLMSHRKVWHEIIQKAKDPNMHYLVLESDSKVKNIQLIEEYYHQIQSKFDLFFGVLGMEMQLFDVLLKLLLKKV